MPSWECERQKRVSEYDVIVTVSGRVIRDHKGSRDQKGYREPCDFYRTVFENGKAYGRPAETSNRTCRTWEIRPSSIVGGPRKTWKWRNCEPTSQPKGRDW